jgi:tRNA (uracil-5-)-methyltransferase TRM9
MIFRDTVLFHIISIFFFLHFFLSMFLHTYDSPFSSCSLRNISRFFYLPCLTTCARSENLARIAVKHQPHSAIVADILNLPHPDSFFDFAISIAVVHHLSTSDRRVQAIREILRTLKPAAAGGPGGKLLIYVWALEQKASRRGWDKGDQQDVMVPWIMKSNTFRDGSSDQPSVFHRYYHLYEATELERDIGNAGGRVLEAGYEKDNWWAIATR